MPRPLLSAALTEPEFIAWYWLKAELVAFCRAHGLATTGSKQAVSKTVAAYLAADPASPRPAVKHPWTTSSATRRAATMPTAFSVETIIGTGWRCTQSLRRFFEAHCGRDFRFNAALREFIAAGSGRPLAEAIAVYEASRKSGPRPIAPQFEYNRHMREHRAAHPGSTHADAVAAWWARRDKPST